MEIINHKVDIIYPSRVTEWVNEARKIEAAARTCYKSENYVSEDSWKSLIKKLKENNHGAMLEFGNFICRITTDRGVSHELVRHRLASYAQESTRYCNYGKNKFNNEVTFIKPVEIDISKNEFKIWKSAMEAAEESYLTMIEEKVKPENARSVLPISLKTEVVMKCNWRELLHMLDLRTSAAAHPDIRYVMNMIKDVFMENIPELF
jgi:thymidylate synthase (FAD)